MNTPRTRRALTAVLALSAALALTATAFEIGRAHV